jgi:hypothetical protein
MSNAREKQKMRILAAFFLCVVGVNPLIFFFFIKASSISLIKQTIAQRLQFLEYNLDT